MTKKRNKGWSFIELVIVLAISGVLMGMAGMSLNLIERANVKKAAQMVEKGLQKARSTSMVKGMSNGEFEIWTSAIDNCTYFQIGINGEPERICNSRIKCNVDLNLSQKGLNPGPGAAWGGGSCAWIKFHPSGALNAADGVRVYLVSANGKRAAEVIVYGLSGKVEMHEL